MTLMWASSVLARTGEPGARALGADVLHQIVVEQQKRAGTL